VTLVGSHGSTRVQVRAHGGAASLSAPAAPLPVPAVSSVTTGAGPAYDRRPGRPGGSCEGRAR